MFACLEFFCKIYTCWRFFTLTVNFLARTFNLVERKNKMSECPVDWISDEFARIPVPISPFPQPLGTDCLLHVPSFQAILSIFVALFIIDIGICLFDFFTYGPKLDPI